MTDTPTCPNCGYGFDALARSTRMFDCPSCDTTLFRAADALQPIGDHGEMHDTPMLVQIGDEVRIDGTDYHVIGHARFDYGRGWWDELWAVDGAEDGIWVSIDEGDVVAQTGTPEGNWPDIAEPPALGVEISHAGQVYRVTETDRAACIAIRGQLPEMLEIGESHDFVNASGPDGMLLSGEFWDGGRAWFEGRWLDPFTLSVRRG